MVRILLIDGDPASVEHFRQAAGGDNAALFELNYCGTLREGLARLAERGADIVFASLSLPDCSGPQTQLRVQARSPDLPLVVLGGAGEEELGRKVVERGAQDFLVRRVFDGAALRRIVLSSLERQARLNALRGREDLVRSLTMMNADGILIVDEEGVVRFSNPAADALFAPRRLAGEPFGHALDPDRPVEVLIEPEGGRPRVVEVRSARIRWKGKPALLASLRDISERQAAADALRAGRDAAQEAARVKSEFVANMSHEIRTPINSILGMAELLAESRLEPEQRESVELLQRSGELLLHLVNNVLDLSKVESGLLALDRVEFDLPRKAELVASTLDRAAKSKGLLLARRFAAGLAPRRVGDPGRLGQVLVNLLANAVKFTEAGSVTLALEPDPAGAGRVLFSVADTGPGVPPEHRGTIFESFRQGDSSMTRKHGGTGLGLAISRKLVAAMGGELALESEPGKGSRFFFSIPLPLAEGEAPAAPSGEGGTAGAFGGDGSRAVARPLRVLLADDSADNRLLVLRFLKGSGHAIDEAADGREAVARFAAGRYDVVLMDMQMPALDGLSATREIRRLEAECGLAPAPIVALTASVDKEDIAHCREAGCTEHLGKPVRKAALLALLARLGGAAARDGDRIEITLDPELGDLVPGYLEHRRRDLRALAEALARRDFVFLARTGHAIRGSAESFGFAPLGPLCLELEQAAKRADEAAARSALARIEGYLARVKLVL